MKRTRLKLLLATGLIALGLNLTPQSASAITTSGVMTTNETWSGNIELTGDVTVPNNVTLTILPGTRVACWDNYDDTAGGVNPNRIELIVNGGRLTSVGSSNNPVRFTSSPLTPPAKRGDWYGIRFLASTNTSTLRWSVVEFGIRGITVTSGNTPVIENCTFQQQSEIGVSYSIPTSLNGCLLSSNGMACEGSGLFMTNSLVRNNGGYGAGAGIHGGATIIDCVVSNNSGSGVHSDGDTVVVSSTTFCGNTGHGIFLSAGNLTVIDSIVVSNGVNGVLCWGSASVTRCRVDANGVEGVQMRSGAVMDTSTQRNGNHGVVSVEGSIPSLVSNCVVRLNGIGGIAIRDTPITVLDSVISYNTQVGIESASPTVRGCSIDHNGIGLRLSPWSVTATGVSGNRITANTSYEMWNAGPAVVIATNNFWGEPTTTELSNNVRNLTKIYDSQDDASVGQVLLKPYLATDPFAVPPQITGQPADLAVAAGATATFTVSATSASPLVYQWRKGTSSLLGQTNSFLSFTAQVSDAATNYNVIVSNSDGSVTSRWATLTVLIAPTITSQPTNLFLPPGTTAAFHVTATGSAPLGYQWQKEGVNLANVGRVSGATSPDLIITSIQASDVGNYRVVVTNTVGAVTSVWARLDLPLPPTITTSPATQVVGVGAPATFSVTATGSTPMNYQWYLNGSVIGGANDASFSIPVTTAAWLGSYQVQVWNSAGTNWSATAGLWLDELKMYAGVNVYGPAGSNCVVQYATNLTAPVTWMPLQSVIIVTNPMVIIDYDSPEQPKRFYRTVPQ